MSELINTQATRNQSRCQLLTTVSTLAIIAGAYGAQSAKADGDADRPTVWIELGGQFEQQAGQGDPYIPPFVGANSNSPVFAPYSPAHSEKPPLFSNGAEGKLSFEPQGTDWVFSASVRYGRSNGRKNLDRNHVSADQIHTTDRQVIGHKTFSTPSGYVGTRPIYGPIKHTRQVPITQFAGAVIAQAQTHAIVDFSAGKDVGLGIFGQGTSRIEAGVRFAQFTSKTSGSLNARPDAKDIKFYNTFNQKRFPSYVWRYYNSAFHSYHVTMQSRRSFQGVGPTVSWRSSLPFAGQQNAGLVSFDWGVNAAALFGRQRASGSHYTSANFDIGYTARRFVHLYPTHDTNSGSFNRSRSIVVPNAGGFAGLAFRFSNAKVSMGYRGDFFFNAMDTGQETRKTRTVGFYGPFATISIGVGG